MREMLSLQPRFSVTRGKRAMKLLEHRRFRAAYDFMVLLSEVSQVDAELATFWTEVQTQTADERASSFQMDSRGSGKRSPRRRRRRKASPKS
jgi:poly(A) polymerase